MYQLHSIFPIAALVITSNALTAPDFVKKFYDDHKSQCTKSIPGGFQEVLNGHDHDAVYCIDVPGVIYEHSTRNYVDMDIDCDGKDREGGACKDDKTGQGQTAFQDQVKKASQNKLEDLDANKIPYVVFGNTGAHPSFDPESHGMKPLSIMAIVCNNQLFYGIWGDTNGGTTTGEASIALALLCFPGEKLTGDNGHSERDVLYIGFIGGDVDPTPATWEAKTASDFSNSLKAKGDRLIERLKGGPSQVGPSQGDPSQGDPSQGDPSQGDPSQGDPSQGDPSQGDPSQGDPSKGGSSKDKQSKDNSSKKKHSKDKSSKKKQSKDKSSKKKHTQKI